jgi:carbamate kinase
MGPKIQAAIDFVQKSVAAGRPNAWAAIGDLRDAAKIVTFHEGTIIREDHSLKDGVIWRPKKETGGDEDAMTSVRKESKEPHKSG